MKLADLKNITIGDVAAAFERDDPRELTLVSITIALTFSDLSAAQRVCLRLAGHAHRKVRGNALVSLGHLARRFRALDESAVKPVIESALGDADEFIRDHARAAADEIHQFLHWDISGHVYGEAPDSR